MNNWRSLYLSKLVSPEEALLSVNSGDRVALGCACGAPGALIEALIDRKSVLRDVEIVNMLTMPNAGYISPGMEPSFRNNSLFVSQSTRKAVGEKRADYTPCFFSEIPRLFKAKLLPLDVTLLQVSPPDEQGFCSYGVSADYTVAASECAKVVIAQINNHMPRTGGARIHLDALTFIVEQDELLVELNPPSIGDIEKRIGETVADLVPDGATLQLGIGAIPDAALLFMKDKKDLGIHSEMFSDGVVFLVEAGVITNRKKTIHAGKLLATFLMGTRKLYDFVHNNPDVEMYPVDYINDPCIIGQHEKMISVNSAIQVDLMGQVNAEMIGNKQFSGIGGQVDFIRGASRSHGGKSIIALPSTANGGKISRICCQLDRGAAVSTSRNDVHYVVTEYGVAELRGKSLRQRVQALINISHPEFRELLTSQARAEGLL
ncbi:acetyl-CoA hydrolase/transferase family protein [Sporomusa aerivorans]|uniref:acetyl-CoA hydrolase/transferase family protein n=1 Tax=Sporomusa aerivorans TaxID=204936 RepID=UPI00352AF17E